MKIIVRKSLTENSPEFHGNSVTFPIKKIRLYALKYVKYLNPKTVLKSCVGAINQK